MNWLKPKEPDKSVNMSAPMEEAIKGQSMIDFQSPFKKESLQRVILWIRKNWKNEVVFEATICYENAQSEGESKLEAETFQGLVDKVNIFINGMPA